MANIRKPYGTSSEGNLINVGTVATPATGTITVKESGSGIVQRTELTLTAVSLIVPVGAANLASGKLIYTLPAGAILTNCEYISVAITGTGSTNSSDTPVLGLGTTIGTGAVAVLSGTAGFVNMMAGQAVADSNGTAKVKTVSTSLVVEASDAHTVHLNIAGAWTGADAGMLATGTVVIHWTLIK